MLSDMPRLADFTARLRGESSVVLSISVFYTDAFLLGAWRETPETQEAKETKKAHTTQMLRYSRPLPGVIEGESSSLQLPANRTGSLRGAVFVSHHL